MLPLLLGAGGAALGGAGLLGTGIGALGAGAIGSGLGSFLQTGDLGKGIATGLTSYFGGKALGSLMGGGADAINAANQANTVGAGSFSDPMRLAGTTSAGMGANTALDAANLGATTAPVTATTGKLGGIFSDPTAAMQTPGSYTGAFTGDAMPFTAGALGTTALGSTNLLAPQGIKEKSPVKDIPEADAAVYNPLTPPKDYRPGVDPEFKYFDNTTSSLASGGIASLNYQEGGMMPQANDKELISNAVDAIEGRVQSPEIALAAFVARYGEEALRDLVGRVTRGEFAQNAMAQDGMVKGVGDGMDDMIPATLEGEQDVVLSDGEFIVPADVVSGIGNGSSDAGSEALYEMMDRVRKLRTGKESQPEQVPQEMMLPA
tara:strand:+ start:7193 stop:8320 length:1128 start_codon:yes stop_codon:yes gene_type:complete